MWYFNVPGRGYFTELLHDVRFPKYFHRWASSFCILLTTPELLENKLLSLVFENLDLINIYYALKRLFSPKNKWIDFVS